jgi:hypothetical protein
MFAEGELFALNSDPNCFSKIDNFAISRRSTLHLKAAIHAAALSLLSLSFSGTGQGAVGRLSASSC